MCLSRMNAGQVVVNELIAAPKCFPQLMGRLTSYIYDKYLFIFYENFSLNINILSTSGLINSTNGRKTLARIRVGLYFYFSI